MLRQAFRRPRARRRSQVLEQLEQRCLLAVITVTSSADDLAVDGLVTLREAIQAANADASVDGSVAGSGADVIRFSSSVTEPIELTPGLGRLVLRAGVTIRGNGIDDTIVDGDGGSVFVVATADPVVVRSLRIRNADAAITTDHSSARLDAREVLLKNNRTAIAGLRGAMIRVIDSDLSRNVPRAVDSRVNQLIVRGSRLYDNTVPGTERRGGGAILQFGGSVVVRDAELTDNTVRPDNAHGGAIEAWHAQTRIVNSTLSGNAADSRVARGGAIRVFRGSLAIEDSIVVDNRVSGDNAHGGAVAGDGAEVRIVNSDLSRNRAEARIARGAAVYLHGGSLLARHSRLDNNRAEADNVHGAAIHGYDAEVRLVDSRATGNLARGRIVHGGVLYLNGALDVTRSVLSDNTLQPTSRNWGGLGSAVYARTATVNLRDSTVVRNIGGGAINVQNHSSVNPNYVHIVNSTVSSNGGGQEMSGASGVLAQGVHSFRLMNSTVVNNAGAPAVVAATSSPDHFRIESSILANPGQPDLVPSSQDVERLAIRRNLIRSNDQSQLAPTDEGQTDANGNMIGSLSRPIDPMLADLADNGSGRETQLPLAGSPVIDAGANPLSLPTDGRGSRFVRRGGDGVDIGAVELSDLVINVSGWPQVNEGNSGSASVLVDVTLVTPIAAPLELTYESVDGTALAGEDFVAFDGRLFFTESGQTRQIEIEILGDELVEPAEHFDVRFLGSGIAVGLVGEPRVEIPPDDFGIRQLGREILVLGGDPAEAVEFRLSDTRDRIEARFRSGADPFGAWQSFDPADVDRVRYTDPAGDNQFLMAPSVEIPVVGVTGGGNDTIQTGGGDDRITTGGGADVVRSGAGDDVVMTAAGADEIDGGAGDDLVLAGASADRISGGSGDDRVDGGAGPDEIDGGSGDDVIHGNLGGDRLFGGADADILMGGAGSDRVEGNTGADTLVGGFMLPALQHFGLPATGLQLDARDHDLLLGGAGADWLDGGMFLHGGSGDDRLEGSRGATLYGGPGADSLFLDEGRVFAGPGDDFFSGWARSTGLVVFGDEGNDRLVAEARDYGRGSVPPLVFHGGPGDDILTGRAGRDQLFGGPGDDVLVGGAASDTLRGGAGNDSLRGGSDDDTLFGEPGDDTLLGGAGNDVVDGGAGNDRLEGLDGTDLMFGRDGADWLSGGDGRNVLIGGTGGDRIGGGGDEDILIAGPVSLTLSELKLVLTEWVSDRTQKVRADNILNGSGGGRENGFAFLRPGGNVFQDSEPDTLLGANAADWFFARSSADVLPDRMPDELFNEIWGRRP